MLPPRIQIEKAKNCQQQSFLAIEIPTQNLRTKASSIKKSDFEIVALSAFNSCSQLRSWVGGVITRALQISYEASCHSSLFLSSRPEAHTIVDIQIYRHTDKHLARHPLTTDGWILLRVQQHTHTHSHINGAETEKQTLASMQLGQYIYPLFSSFSYPPNCYCTTLRT